MSTIEHNTGVLISDSNKVPPIGTTGKFILDSNWTKIIDTNIEYTCIASNTISSLMDLGKDVLNEVYIPLENLLGQSVYNAQNNYNIDLELNTTIITLQSGTGLIVYIPVTAITDNIDNSGIQYSRKYISIDTGVIPDNLNLDSIITELQSLLESKLGIISPEIIVSIFGEVVYLNQTQHQQVENIRINRITNNNTMYSELLQKDLELNDLRTKLQANENYILYLKDQGII